MDNTRFYVFEMLKPEFNPGNHFIVVGFSTPFCLHLPYNNYLVKIEFQERVEVAQIILEKRKRVATRNALPAGHQEALNYADKHGRDWYTFALIHIPIQDSDPKIHNSIDEMQKVARKQHSAYQTAAIKAFNYLIDAYRVFTGECHVNRLQGRDSLFDYSVALIFNMHTVVEFLVTASKNTFPTEPIFPESIVNKIHKKLISNPEISLAEDLLLNAYNLFDQGNHRLAIIEAETAFEVAVRQYLRTHFQNRGILEAIREIDAINQFKDLLKNSHFIKTIRPKKFEPGEVHYDKWEKHVWRVRSNLVHGVNEYVHEEEAVNALTIVETTLEYLFERKKTAQNVLIYMGDYNKTI